MKPTKILIIMGSSRSHGDTRKIVDAIIPKTKAHFIDLNTYKISYFDYEHRNKDDDFVEIATKMVEYEQILKIFYQYSLQLMLVL